MAIDSHTLLLDACRAYVGDRGAGLQRILPLDHADTEFADRVGRGETEERTRCPDVEGRAARLGGVGSALDGRGGGRLAGDGRRRQCRRPAGAQRSAARRVDVVAVSTRGLPVQRGGPASSVSVSDDGTRPRSSSPSPAAGGGDDDDVTGGTGVTSSVTSSSVTLTSALRPGRCGGARDVDDDGQSAAASDCVAVWSTSWSACDVDMSTRCECSCCVKLLGRAAVLDSITSSLDAQFTTTANISYLVSLNVYSLVDCMFIC